ncbi:uncharacterized protein LOC120674710 [Panicum virgatum]|uniref:uncharacterized protein LOC120674710 n=1 Tax=Panicum virgatum TaxID=38727 RepID=UPI0019D5D57F|nr:uncharacterized protein LOC120674710 [Panicum virgatum]
MSALAMEFCNLNIWRLDVACATPRAPDGALPVAAAARLVLPHRRPPPGLARADPQGVGQQVAAQRPTDRRNRKGRGQGLPPRALLCAGRPAGARRPRHCACAAPRAPRNALLPAAAGSGRGPRGRGQSGLGGSRSAVRHGATAHRCTPVDRGKPSVNQSTKARPWLQWLPLGSEDMSVRSDKAFSRVDFIDRKLLSILSDIAGVMIEGGYEHAPKSNR